MGRYQVAMMRTNILVSILLCFSLSVHAGHITVSANSAHSIGQAIDKAHPGDTLFIQKGTYKEHNITVNKRLIIIGVDYPVIDGEKKYEVLTVAADSVVIKGLQIQHTGTSGMDDIAAIKIKESDYVQVAGNKLLDNTYGIYLQKSNYCVITGNVLTAYAKDEQNSGNGIHAWQGKHLFISGNSIRGHRDGIYFEFVTESRIVKNVSTKNVRYGLHFMFSNNDAYEQNTFSENGSGVAVMFSKGVTMKRNRFSHNWGDAAYGLLLKEISDGNIEGNIFEKNTVGIFMEGANRIFTTHNTFRENGWAMRIQASCSNGTFIENNFISNSFDVATNGTLVMNVFKANYWDKYTGYDLDKNKVGDVPYYPVSLYAVLTEHVPATMILYRSLLTDIMDQVEKVMPSFIPDKLKDDYPMMRKWNLQ